MLVKGLCKFFCKISLSGILSGTLELVKEGNISIKQKKLFDDIFIKENK